MQYFLTEVVSSKIISPSMIEVELGGGDLDHFQPCAQPDEWLRIILPHAEGAQISLPQLVDGDWEYPAGKPKSPIRSYSVRHWDQLTKRMIIHFVLHAGGIASSWAVSAQKGDPIGLTSSRGYFAPPEDTDWILLLSDITGLPAVSRILETVDRNTKVLAHIEVPVLGDRHEVANSSHQQVTWYDTGGDESGTRLSTIGRQIVLPSGNGYLWVAGQAKQVSAMRDYYRNELKIDKDRIVAIGYWHGK